MDFSLTEEQELLLASIRELITTNFPEEYFRTCDQNGTYPREFMRALADNGISMLGVPEEFGGIPADYVTQMLALMEVSKCGAPAFLITNGQCIHSMRRFGSAEQLRKTAESTLETGDPAGNQDLPVNQTVPVAIVFPGLPPFIGQDDNDIQIRDSSHEFVQSMMQNRLPGNLHELFRQLSAHPRAVSSGYHDQVFLPVHFP